MNRPLRAVLVSVLLGAVGCVSSPAPRCAAGEDALVEDVLYFGTRMPDGVVDDAAWAAFLRDVVTARFPDGLTAWEASGQWRAADGGIVREGTRVLMLAHAGTEESNAAVRAIADDYRTRFRQEAVLRLRTPVCASWSRDVAR